MPADPRIVLKIGGSFLLKEGKPDVTSLEEMAEVVRTLAKERVVIVVVGGGISARNYIGAAQQLGANKGVMDHLGILVSRLNARVFIEALGDDSLVAAEPAESLQAVRHLAQLHRVVVLGGLQPGQSTTAVSALCAEYCGAERVVYATDVDGVYTADPSSDPTAEFLPVVSYARLRELCVTGGNSGPGQYRLMDGVALTILERSAILATICKGAKGVVLQAAAGADGVGTRIAADGAVAAKAPAAGAGAGKGKKGSGKRSGKK